MGTHDAGVHGSDLSGVIGPGLVNRVVGYDTRVPGQLPGQVTPKACGLLRVGRIRPKPNVVRVVVVLAPSRTREREHGEHHSEVGVVSQI
ncbi:MAG: hypothetical protein AAGJ19_08835 [Myxococcota bacterium]